MKKYCFLMDTAGDQECASVCEDTYVMPFSMIVNDGTEEKVYDDWYGISREQILETLDKGYDLKTAQAPFGKLYDKIETLLKEYELVVCFSITKEFSGTYESLLSIKKSLEEEYGKNRILVLDTRAISVLTTEECQIVKNMLDANKSLDEIEKEIKAYTQHYIGVTCITNATQLVKGGRLKGLKALLVKALNLKLVIKYEDGKLEFADKSKNLPGAIDKSFEIAEKTLNFKKYPPKNVYIFSDLVDKKETEQMTQYLKLKFNQYENVNFIEGHGLSNAVVAHLGNHSFTFICTTEYKK